MWMENASCDVHHIIPKKCGGTNEHSNLTVLCPNCHREAHEHNQRDFVSIETVLGDSWKDHYFPDGTRSEKVRKMISDGMKKSHQGGSRQ